jgi:hypothetical protein
VESDGSSDSSSSESNYLSSDDLGSDYAANNKDVSSANGSIFSGKTITAEDGACGEPQGWTE